MMQKQISRLELASYLLCPSLFVMVALMVAEAMLAAATTWLVINVGFKVANGHFLLNDLIWILTAQSASYVAGVISWIFAEAQIARGNRQRDRRAGLSARRMGRQSRRGKQGQGRRAGRGARRARAGGRNLAP